MNTLHKKFLTLMAGVLLLRLITAHFSTGYNHPDELFQVLEPAYGKLTGQWVQEWEWVRGIRSWFLPDCFFVLMKFFRMLGVSTPSVMAELLRMSVAVFSLLGLYSLWRLAKEWLGQTHALIYLLLLSSSWVLTYFSVRTLSDSLAIHVVWSAAALLFVDSKKAGVLRLLLAGAVATLAYGLRFQCGIFTATFFFILLAQRRYKPALAFFCGALPVLLALGGLDRLTWGQWFHAPIEYVRFNLLENGAAQYGVAPWHRYFSLFARQWGAPAAILIFFGWALTLKNKKTRDQTRLAWTCVLPFFFIHLLLQHKEDRFLLPILPVLLMLAYAGWAEVWNNTQKKNLVVGVLLVLYLPSQLYGWCTHRFTWMSDVTSLYENIGIQLHPKHLVVIGAPSAEASNFYVGAETRITHRKNAEDLTVDDLQADTWVLRKDSEKILKVLTSKKGNSCKLTLILNNPLYQCTRALPEH